MLACECVCVCRGVNFVAPYQYFCRRKIRHLNHIDCVAILCGICSISTEMKMNYSLWKSRRINWCTKLCMQQMILRTVSNVTLWHTHTNCFSEQFPSIHIDLDTHRIANTVTRNTHSHAFTRVENVHCASESCTLN